MNSRKAQIKSDRDWKKTVASYHAALDAAVKSGAVRVLTGAAALRAFRRGNTLH